MSAQTHTIRVRYSESDQMGLAHHAAYVTWLEECRIEWLRQTGCSYRDLEERGILMPVIDVHITYRRSLRFDDIATCVTAAERVGPSRVAFTTRIMHDDTLCAEATVVVAAVDKGGRPQRLPADVQSLIPARLATT